MIPQGDLQQIITAQHKAMNSFLGAAAKGIAGGKGGQPDDEVSPQLSHVPAACVLAEPVMSPGKIALFPSPLKVCIQAVQDVAVTRR